MVGQEAMGSAGDAEAAARFRQPVLIKDDRPPARRLPRSGQTGLQLSIGKMRSGKLRTAMPMLHKATPERLSAFSNGVFAVLITVLVLDLRPPGDSHLSGAPVALAQVAELRRELSLHRHCLDNHHYLMRYAREAAPPRLLWFNFAHLFSMSLLPFSTAWMAVSELAPQPVAFYAAVFFLVNATYICLIWELVDGAPAPRASPRVRRIMRFRSIATLCLSGLRRLSP